MSSIHLQALSYSQFVLLSHMLCLRAQALSIHIQHHDISVEATCRSASRFANEVDMSIRLKRLPNHHDEVSVQ